VPYWQLGGPSKARLRVTEDESKMLELGPDFTVGLLFRAGAGEEPGYDSLLLGDDNKHWLALPGGDRSTVCCVEGASGKASEVKAEVGREDWMQLFLRPAPDGGTALLGVDGEGLLELGTFAHQPYRQQAPKLRLGNQRSAHCGDRNLGKPLLG